jgi:hypothetical protein
MLRYHTCVDSQRIEGETFWLYDGYGYPFALVCNKCKDDKLSKFRSDIMEQYDTDEPLDED